MASNPSKNDMGLSVSDPPKGDERLFKGSGMAKRGAYAAISYMSCAETRFNRYSVLKFHQI
ncbi:nucleotide/sugar transporter family protein [Actinidia rufa]|uniref:Nucleotide/sugar transporter family protein n=1 Tax=Actinidia rufa TaxID=165716 RepID=A0A7J0GC30_9ERIC|nr:nucleotide/sugar transporter family protein [Actinidia rufa]